MNLLTKSPSPDDLKLKGGQPVAVRYSLALMEAASFFVDPEASSG